MIPTPPRQNRPRHRRVEEGERPPMALTERDGEIIRLVHDCRLLTGEHIRTLFFASRSTAQYRLQRLFQHEFLNRHFLTRVTTAPAASPALYSLGRRGVQVLVDRYGYERDAIRLPRQSSLGWHTVEHTLAINTVRLAIMRAASLHGWTLLEWRDEGQFRAAPDYVGLMDGRGRTVEKPVLPDGYGAIETPRGVMRFFLEVDRGTEQLSKVAPQIAVYQAYTTSGLYQERFQARSLRILIVTTGEKRLLSLKRVVEAEGGDRKYWFTTIEAISAETVLTAPIWEAVSGRQQRPLVE
ncbi:MAG: replication-relaxation family protein [Anaerolineae bacterium]|nr:replication-relaxation family protein [Anaerolineae bacterium]